MIIFLNMLTGKIMIKDGCRFWLNHHLPTLNLQWPSFLCPHPTSPPLSLFFTWQIILFSHILHQQRFIFIMKNGRFSSPKCKLKTNLSCRTINSLMMVFFNVSRSDFGKWFFFLLCTRQLRTLNRALISSAIFQSN